MRKAILASVMMLAAMVVGAAPLAADKIANMQAQNDFVMDGGVCAVANGEKPKPGTKLNILLGSKLVKIDAGEAYKIGSAGYVKNKRTGRYLMSERLAAACKKDADSDGCVYARSRWSQEPLGLHRPGNGVGQ